MIDANRIKAARALLEWSQADLAANSSVSLPTIRRMESKGIDSCYHRSVASVENTLAKAGIIFPDKMTIKILEPYQNKKELQKHLKERAEKMSL